ncbi:hypothetical protein D3C75_1200720 [compost metagenome]
MGRLFVGANQIQATAKGRFFEDHPQHADHRQKHQQRQRDAENTGAVNHQDIVREVGDRRTFGDQNINAFQ